MAELAPLSEEGLVAKVVAEALGVAERPKEPLSDTLALDWSYDLLSEPAKVLFRRLSIFAGGWTLEASRAVASGEGIEECEVLDLLSDLVEKSLALVNKSSDGGMRYRLLEPVRQYASDKLEEKGETEAAKCAHGQYFLTLAEEAEPELLGPQEARWYERLEEEHDNLGCSACGRIGARVYGGRIFDLSPERGIGKRIAISFFSVSAAIWTWFAMIAVHALVIHRRFR